MNELAREMRKIEEALAKGEREGLDLEALALIELSAEKLPGLAGLVGQIDMNTHGEMVFDAITRCRDMGADVLLCDLAETYGRLPTLQALKRDPGFRVVWGYLNRLATVHPVLDFRECPPSGPPVKQGDLLPRYEADGMACPRPCLILKPGRLFEEDYRKYIMSGETSFSEYREESWR